MSAKILIATGEFPPYTGGAGYYTAEFASAVQAAGLNVSVLAPDYCLPSCGERFGLQSVMPEFPVAGPKPRRILAAARVLARTVSRLRPAAVVLADVNAHRAGALCLHLAPLLLVHGSEVLSLLQRRFLRLCFSSVYTRAPLLFANSEYTKGLLVRLGVPRPRVAVYYPGVESAVYQSTASLEKVEALRRKWGVPSPAYVVLSVSRLVSRKGIDTGIRVVAQLQRENIEVRYLIAGEGPEENRLKKLAAEMSCEGNVLFLGSVGEVEKIELYDLSDAYMMLSRQIGFDVEGYGISFAEAAMRARPALGTRHGGIPEVVEDGVTGFLMLPEKAELEAAERLKDLVRRPDLGREMGAAARARMSRLLEERSLSPLIALLDGK